MINRAPLEKSQGMVTDAMLDADPGSDLNRLLTYASLAQSMAHDCSIVLRVMQNAAEFDTGDEQALVSGYGIGALQRLIANSMSLVASEGERILCDLRSDTNSGPGEDATGDSIPI